MLVELHYCCTNGGDGSVAVHFFKTEKEAEEYEENEEQLSGEGWGESSVGSIKLSIDSNGHIANQTYFDCHPEWREEDELEDKSLVNAK